MNANRGYSGWSKSNRAVEAEENGLLPLTRAIKAVAESAGVTRKVAREALLAVGPAEWHHTSKHFNRTDYYKIGAALGWLEMRPIIAKLPSDWEDQISSAISAADKAAPENQRMAARHAAITSVCQRLADQAGSSVADIKSSYYETWEQVGCNSSEDE